MKKQIAILFTIISTNLCFGQLLHLPIWYDFSYINHTVDSLVNVGTNEIIIFRTEKEIHKIVSEDSIIDCLIWKNKDSCFIRVLTQDKVFPIVSFIDKGVFNFKNMTNTFVTQDEQVYQFIPPMTNNNAVFYVSPSKQGYFELPDKLNQSPTTYVPNNQKKEKIRFEWYDLIYQTILEINFNFNKFENYDRYQDFEIK